MRPTVWLTWDSLTGDRTFNANIWATSPTFGMLAKEGSYTITFNGANQASGNFDLSAEGRASINVDYESFFVTKVKTIFWTPNTGAISLDGGFQTTICIAFGVNQITINQATELVEDVS